MFALAFRYLNGWAMAAADGARKERAEWPPHPDRVFMALAAAWFETDQDPAEGAALRWLEALDPPCIAASPAEIRQTLSTGRPPVSFVPVNDARVGRKAPDSAELGKLRDAGLAVLPEHRSRQPRSFPVVVPHDPCVRLIWPQAQPAEHLEPLGRLAAKVTHIGHAASLVQAWVDDVSPDPAWVPVDGATTHRLRVTTAGRLDALERTYNRAAMIAYADLDAARKAAKGKERTGLQKELEARFGDTPPVSAFPSPVRWAGYDRPAVDQIAQPHSVFDPRLVVLRLTGKRLDLESTLRVMDALRGALLSTCPQPIPPWVSGHEADGAPSRQPHVAFLPLPFVDAEHADGHLLGVALAMPAGIAPQAVAQALNPLLWDRETGAPARIRLFDGQWFECVAELEQREMPPRNVQSDTWTQAAQRWGSVTPVVLDRHCDGARRWSQAEEVVKDACERIGLPRPAAVVLSGVSPLRGVPPARSFPPLLRKGNGGRRQHLHAEILFDEPVVGPVLVGAGRFRGYGLLRPLGGRVGHV
ncbi:type I-G CRISPR-associated protein Csb2 [Immundisolibacter sp.]